MQTAFVSGAAALRPRVQGASACGSKAFFGTRPVQTSRVSVARVRMGAVLPVFTDAMKDFKDDYPEFAKLGWGATVKAERWNGRHAMFGLLAIVLTGYCKGHGLLPDATPLDLAAWGTLARLGDGAPITNQRAVILIAHIHVLLVSVAAALAPFTWQDKLLLEDGEADEEPAGLFPPFSPGLTKDAELWNGRVAMLGVCSIVGVALATQTSILDVVNVGLGSILY